MRKKEEWPAHDKAVDAIASMRFPFPDKDHPDWQTHTNPDQKQDKGIKTNDTTFYPDIVVVNTTKNVAEMVGEVETESTVTTEAAKQWAEYSRLSDSFFLYVPDGYGKAAQRLLDENKIQHSGIRTYQFDDSRINIMNL